MLHSNYPNKIGRVKIRGEVWMEIRNDRQKGLSCTETARKYRLWRYCVRLKNLVLWFFRRFALPNMVLPPAIIWFVPYTGLALTVWDCLICIPVLFRIPHIFLLYVDRCYVHEQKEHLDEKATVRFETHAWVTRPGRLGIFWRPIGLWGWKAEKALLLPDDSGLFTNAVRGT